jgi:hypothetical protein
MSEQVTGKRTQLTSPDPLVGACSSFYAEPGERQMSCVDALAEGAITASDFCPACTRWFMAAIEAQAGRPMVRGWHRYYAERAQLPGHGSTPPT